MTVEVGLSVIVGVIESVGVRVGVCEIETDGVILSVIVGVFVSVLVGVKLFVTEGVILSVIVGVWVGLLVIVGVTESVGV